MYLADPVRPAAAVQRQEDLADIESLAEVGYLAGQRELGYCSASLYILMLGYIPVLGFKL